MSQKDLNNTLTSKHSTPPAFYKASYQIMWKGLPNWKRGAILDDPTGRVALEFASEVAKYAEDSVNKGSIYEAIKEF